MKEIYSVCIISGTNTWIRRKKKRQQEEEEEEETTHDNSKKTAAVNHYSLEDPRENQENLLNN